MHVDRKIFTTHFACDLHACKAACCTFPGGSGPPVLPEEISILKRAWEELQQRVPVEHQEWVKNEGLFVDDDGETTISCYEEKACVFVEYEQEIARCSIQKAYETGDFPWMKPLSCHLFPIRIHGRQRDRLRFERFSECEAAFHRGKELALPLVDFLEEALVRALGTAGFAALKQRSDALQDGGG